MDALKIGIKISRNSIFRADVRARKNTLIQKAVALPGQTVWRTFDNHVEWTSADGRYIVGVGKFGKEFYSNTITWRDGHKGNNPNDMHPTVWVDGVEKEFDGSFDHVFAFFQHVSRIDTKALEVLGCLMYRNAFLLDHDTALQYCPPREAIDYLNSVLPEYDGISVEAYLHYLEMIAWNEDVKYSTLGYDVHAGTGRENNMLTYAHLIAVLLGRASISKLCSQFSRPPVGVSPITIAAAQMAFPMLEIE